MISDFAKTLFYRDPGIRNVVPYVIANRTENSGVGRQPPD